MPWLWSPLYREGDSDIFSELAEEFQLKILISAPIDDLFTLPQLYRTAREALELMKDERFHGEAVCTAQQLRTPLLRLAGASVLLIAAPGARLLLPAVPAAQAGALAHALAEEAP